MRERFRNFYRHFYTPHYYYPDVAAIVASFMRGQGHHAVENCPLCNQFIIVRLSRLPNLEVILGTKVGQPWNVTRIEK
jgi:hypothetical protein